MQFKLDKLVVKLHSASVELLAVWQRLFENWMVPASDPRAGAATLFDLQLLSGLPDPPPHFRLFHHPEDLLEVFAVSESAIVVRFPGAAQVFLDLQDNSEPIRGLLTELGLRREQLEDITLTCLAPRLRRLGSYLVHAAALARLDEAILLVGPSGSGKTTTALNLALNGWQLLANDAALLAECAGDLSALATPGEIRLRSGALGYLPLPEVLEPLIDRRRQATVVERRGPLAIQPHACAPVRRLYFLRVSGSDHCRLSPLHPAIALARLCEQSLDRWDEPALVAHLDFLQRLCRQATCYQLDLGANVSELVELLDAG